MPTLLRKQARHTVSLAVAILCVWSVIPSASVWSAPPGGLVEWKVGPANSPVRIRFRFCPAGTIQSGRPIGPKGNARPDPTTGIVQREFHMCETEITLDQFRAVLGPAALEPMLREAEKLKSLNPQLLSLLQNGKDEPVFLVGLESAVLFCAQLQDMVKQSRDQVQGASLEEVQFRLPSHVEWQYAARGTQTLDEEYERPHFSRWSEYKDLSSATASKCEEIWATLGRTDKFTGRQEHYLMIAASTGAAEKEKVKDVLRECFKLALSSPDRKASGLSDIRAVAKGKPGQWGIYDIHDNVSEWVICTVTPAQTRTVWQSLVEKVRAGKPIVGESSVFLAGGSFTDSFDEPNGILRFTIWGGPKMVDNLQPAPFEYQRDQVSEFSPGFRPIMDRNIREDWLFALRSGLFERSEFRASAGDFLIGSKGLLAELATKEHPAWASVQFYEGLMQLKQGKKKVAATLFNQLAQASSKVPSVKKSLLDRFAADEDKAKTESSPAEKPQVNDDQLFWQSLSRVVESDKQ